MERDKYREPQRDSADRRREQPPPNRRYEPYRDDRRQSSYGRNRYPRDTRYNNLPRERGSGGYLPPRRNNNVGTNANTPSGPRNDSNQASLDSLRKDFTSKWDITPKGFENISAEKVKLVGLFQKPGAKRQRIDYRRALMLLNASSGLSSGNDTGNGQDSFNVESTKLSLENSKLSRMVILQNVQSFNVGKDQLLQFLNNFIITLNTDASQGKDQVIKENRLVHDNNDLVIEFINESVATVVAGLNGQLVPSLNETSPLNVVRPDGYISKSTNSSASDQSVDSDFKFSADSTLVINNIPKTIEESELKQLLIDTLTPLDAKLINYQLLKNQLTLENTGLIFINVSSENLELVVEKLQGFKLQDNDLNCFKACLSKYKQDFNVSYLNIAEVVDAKLGQTAEATKVVQFLNCTDAKDFEVPGALQALKKDFFDQCSKFGKVVDIKVPTPKETVNIDVASSIYVRFDSIESSTVLYQTLGGYKYRDRTVLTCYYSEKDYDLGILF